MVTLRATIARALHWFPERLGHWAQFRLATGITVITTALTLMLCPSEIIREPAAEMLGSVLSIFKCRGLAGLSLS
jgi:hypothetical protein